jgi:hypothetical protein
LEEAIAGTGSRLFEEGRMRGDKTAANEHELYEQIGRLKMEVEWLGTLTFCAPQ